MSVPAGPASNEQYLTFSLSGEEYGLDILKVQEIRGSSHVTPLPLTPSHTKGVINLRGAVIPIVDLRERLGLEPIGREQRSVTIVVSLGRRMAGLVVDAVTDVLSVSPSEWVPTPELSDVDVSHLRGLAKSGERLVLLLDIERILGAESARSEDRS